jgi:hypothetical protein
MDKALSTTAWKKTCGMKRATINVVPGRVPQRRTSLLLLLLLLLLWLTQFVRMVVTLLRGRTCKPHAMFPRLP